MQTVRKETTISIVGMEFKLQSLVPADFLGEDCWPFHFYSIRGEPVASKEWEWDGGIKPKWALEADARVRKILSLGIVSPKLSTAELVLMAQKKEYEALRQLLIGALFVLSYGVAAEGEVRELSRLHLEEIGIKSRMLALEPWEIMFGESDLPEGLNPRRYDFNTIVLMVMFERDNALRSQFQ
jgi:hypothetical protein